MQKTTKNKINVDISKYIKYLRSKINNTRTKIKTTKILIDNKKEEAKIIDSKLVQNNLEIKQVKTSLKQLRKEKKDSEIKELQLKLEKLKQKGKNLEKKLCNKRCDIKNTKRHLKNLYILYKDIWLNITYYN